MKTFHAAALTIFNAQQHVHRSPTTFNIAFQLNQCCPSSSSSRANNFQAPEFYSLNKKMSYLIRTGRISEARELFDSIKHRNTITWNTMITGYVKRREMTKARQLFDEMPNRDIVSWNMLSGYISCGGRYIESGQNLFDKIPERDCVSWNTILSGYAKNGMMDKAEELFNYMHERNVVSWNAMVSGYLMNGYVEKAIEFFKIMPERDSASLSALVSGLIQNEKLVEAERILLHYSGSDGRGDLVHA